MSEIKKLEIALEGIGFILTQGFMAVPRYQRSYSWEDSNVMELFQDISGAISRNEQEYFLGAMVVSKKGDGKIEVVDGQQRLATITIFLAAIRNHYLSIKDESRAGDIEADYLFKKDLRTQEKNPRLTLNAYDNDYFRTAILDRPGQASSKKLPQRDSNKSILLARKIAEDFIKSVVKVNPNADHLIDWIDYIREKVKIILVTVPDHTNAFLIFETLNDRGLELSIADLLKNFLFGEAKDRIEELQRSWTAMLGILEAAGIENITVTFLRHLWASLHGPVREKQLYESIKKRITSKQRAVEFGNTLEKSAKLYAALLNPQHEMWKEYSEQTRKSAQTLIHLGLGHSRPLLMAVLEKFNKKEVEKTFRYMVSVSVRYLIVGGLGSGMIERIMAEIPPKIRNEKINTRNELALELKENVPPDEVFKDSFFRASVSRANIARYYLCALEKIMNGEKEPELVPNENQEEINLEHILPENPSEKWGTLNPDDVKRYYKRIGNLTLLKQKVNSKIGNNGFSEKKKVYKISKLKITQGLVKNEKWGYSEIEERQKRLAKLALKAWPL